MTYQANTEVLWLLLVFSSLISSILAKHFQCLRKMIPFHGICPNVVNFVRISPILEATLSKFRTESSILEFDLIVSINSCQCGLIPYLASAFIALAKLLNLHAKPMLPAALPITIL